MNAKLTLFFVFEDNLGEADYPQIVLAHDAAEAERIVRADCHADFPLHFKVKQIDCSTPRIIYDATRTRI